MDSASPPPGTPAWVPGHLRGPGTRRRFNTLQNYLFFNLDFSASRAFELSGSLLIGF